MERASRFVGVLHLPEDPHTAEQLACAAWRAAVGKKLVARTRAERLVRKRLIVSVEDAVWQRQLYTLRHQILERMRQNLDLNLVEELEFRVMPPKRAPERAAKAAPLFTGIPDEAEHIADPGLRRIYRLSRKKEQQAC